MKFENLNKTLEYILFPKPILIQKIKYKIDCFLRKVGILCNHSMEYVGLWSDRKCSKCGFYIEDPRPRHFNCRCVLVPMEKENE